MGEPTDRMNDSRNRAAEPTRTGQSGVEETDHLWIPMPDGVRLAARLWLPADARQTPVPALLEYIPYRKADMVRARDERNHPYFAAHGYACLRVDVRGSGDSDGVMADMYADHELSDARHVIEWIAAQPWCSGAVGMFGTSWGGTAALQANIDPPSALKAVIAVCATHDRYEDDIHHMGGCLLTDTFEWGATLPAILAAPPTPNVGPDWRSIWEDRLARLTFPLENWLREEARGKYWRHGSVKYQTSRLGRPILAVGGWSDRYCNSVMSLVSARPDLVWGVIGPWGHHYPDHGHPGPAIGFQKLALDWWDHWLKDMPKCSDWPRLRTWLREYDPPSDAIDLRRGSWIESDAWKKHTRSLSMGLGSDALAATSGDATWTIPDDLNIGSAAGDTGYFGRYGGLPLDQQADDRRCLGFETGPFDKETVVFGAPLIRLNLQSSGMHAQLVIRLCDVAPNGSVGLITRTVRNLALDENLDAPDAADPIGGALVVGFPAVAYRLRRGHRLRVSLSGSYWPLIWPAPGSAHLEMKSGTLELPVFEGPPTALCHPLPMEADHPARASFVTLAAPRVTRHSNGQSDGRRIEGWHQPYSAVHYRDTGTTFGFETQATYTIQPPDPYTARADLTHRTVYDRPDGKAEIESSLSATADARSYRVDAALTARWDGGEIASRRWSIAVPRKLG
ncbi:MAG: CocE/NonD family hydrolase [Pseudomonadota bacterium]